jgi:hypothetical protein
MERLRTICYFYSAATQNSVLNICLGLMFNREWIYESTRKRSIYPGALCKFCPLGLWSGYDYQKSETFNEDLVTVAKQWMDQGATRLHLVDLDGAKAGEQLKQNPINRSTQQHTYLLNPGILLKVQFDQFQS